jgi:hypothetical protein
LIESLRNPLYISVFEINFAIKTWYPDTFPFKQCLLSLSNFCDYHSSFLNYRIFLLMPARIIVLWLGCWME